MNLEFPFAIISGTAIYWSSSCTEVKDHLLSWHRISVSITLDWVVFVYREWIPQSLYLKTEKYWNACMPF